MFKRDSPEGDNEREGGKVTGFRIIFKLPELFDSPYIIHYLFY